MFGRSAVENLEVFDALILKADVTTTSHIWSNAFNASVGVGHYNTYMESSAVY